jgi:general secretion pathway protein B
MSFILDALKKSESDRQRQTGPALFEVKVAPPKARFPLWTVAIVALLVINMVIVGWLLLRRSSRTDETAAQNPPTSVTSQTAPPATRSSAPDGGTWSPSVATVPPQSAGAPANTNGPANNGVSQTYPPPPNVPTSAADSAPMSRSAASNAPASNAQASGASVEESHQSPVHLPDRDQNEPTLAGSARDSSADSGGATPDDYAPAADPGSPIFKGHVRRGTESGLMLYQDLAVTNGANLPPIRLDLHVYAAKPQDRFALINMHKLHEGDSIEGGVRVEAITPDGVVMSHNGTKFLLPRE